MILETIFDVHSKTPIKLSETDESFQKFIRLLRAKLKADTKLKVLNASFTGDSGSLDLHFYVMAKRWVRTRYDGDPDIKIWVGFVGSKLKLTGGDLSSLYSPGAGPTKQGKSEYGKIRGVFRAMGYRR